MTSLGKKPPQQVSVRLHIGIKDALDLIPEYSGKDAIEFVHFRDGCEEASALLGCKHDKTLLKFIKLKLKGMAYARYSLFVSSALSLAGFLDTMQMELCENGHRISFWEEKIKSIRQEVGESARDYGARMEDALACALIGTIGHYPLRGLAVREFKKNMISERVRDYIDDPQDDRGDIVDAVIAAEQWVQENADSIKCKICNSIFHTDDKCSRAKGQISPYRGGFLLGIDNPNIRYYLRKKQLSLLFE